MRTLPKINLEGTDFYIDLNSAELRQAQYPFNSIPFSSMESTRDGYHYRFLYDTVAKGIHLVPEDLNKLPPNIVQLQIPYEVKLDPVGAALLHNAEVRRITRHYPVQENMKAEKLKSSNPHPQLIKRIQTAKQRLIQSLPFGKKFKR